MNKSGNQLAGQSKVDFKTITDKINNILTGEDGLEKKLIEALKHKNPEEYKKYLQQVIDELFKPPKGKFCEHIGKPSYGAVHYVSHYLGRWFRSPFEKENARESKFPINQTTRALIDNTYDRAPLKLNLVTWNDIREDPIIFQFGKDESVGSKYPILPIAPRHVDIIWKCLKASTNYYEFLSGGPFIVGPTETDENYGHDDSRQNQFFKTWFENNNDLDSNDKSELRKLIKDYFEKLERPKDSNSESLQEGKKGEGKKPPSGVEQGKDAEVTDDRFRLLVSSIIYTLFAMKPDRNGKLGKLPENVNYGIVIPIRLGSNKKSNTETENVLGGYGGLYKDIPHEQQQLDSTLERIEEILNILFLRFNSLETKVLHTFPREISVQAEDTIRICSEVDKNNRDISNRRRGYVDALKSILEQQRQELTNRLNDTFCNDCKKDYCEDVVKVITNKIESWESKLIGGSEIYKSLLEKTTQAVFEEFWRFLQKRVGEKDENGKWRYTDRSEGYVGTVFLYGEEGVGKQLLPEIFHWLNPRLYCAKYRGVEILKIRDAMQHTCEKVLDLKDIGVIPLKKGGESNYSSRIRTMFVDEELKDYFFREWRENLKAFNFTDLNSAAYSKEEFYEKLFRKDKEKDFGIIQEMSFLSGTIFLDEVDKAVPSEVNKLLKVIEDPFEYPLRLDKEDNKNEGVGKANLLFIFNSNVPWEVLSQKGKFTSAFIYRIGKHRFTVPPLRERKEDIALFINYQLSKWEEPYLIRNIDPHGLRLLCELPWPNNYRGLMGFLDTLKTERRLRGITSPKISFDEILDCLRILELVHSRSHKKAFPTTEENVRLVVSPNT